MEPHTEQHLNDLGKRIIKDANLESPSLDFTQNLMAKIEAQASTSSIVYKPLISKVGWVCIILVLSAVSIYLSLSGSKDTMLFNTIDYSSLTKHSISKFISGVTIPKTVAYAIGFFGLVWCIQIALMKQVLDNKLGY